MLNALFAVAYGLETPFFPQLAAPNPAPKTETYRQISEASCPSRDGGKTATKRARCRSSRLLASRFNSGFRRIFSRVRELQSLVLYRAPLQAQNVADIVLIHSPGCLRALLRPTSDGSLDVSRREFLHEERDRGFMAVHGRDLAHTFPLHIVQ